MTFKKFATKNLAALLLLPIGITLLMAFGNPLKTNDAKIALLRAEHGGGGGDRDIYDVLIQKAYKIYPDFAKWVVESRTAIAEANSFEKNISYLENRRDAYYKEAEAEAESIEDATLRESVMKKIISIVLYFTCFQILSCSTVETFSEQKQYNMPIKS